MSSRVFRGLSSQAATFYASLFKDSKVLGVTRYGTAGPGPEGR